MSATTSTRPRPRFSLNAFREELYLFQEESQFFQYLLRLTQPSTSSDQLQERWKRFQRETLTGLLRALRTLESQSSNATRAGNGQSHTALFVQGLESARRQITHLKRDALRELNERKMPLSIW